MSQGALSVPSASGAAVRAGFNAALARLATKGSGTARPSDIAAGEHWIETDNPGTGVWAMWLYDGTTDILDAIIDTTNHLIHRVTGQQVEILTGAVATGTTTTSTADTIPTNTQGDQYMSLAITPLRATSKLDFDITCFLESSGAPNSLQAALFQDSTANALASGVVSSSAAGRVVDVGFPHVMVSGTTSSTTFKVLAGGNTAGTTTFNGASGTRIHGGVLRSGIKIVERLA